MSEDKLEIRWLRRLSNYQKALDDLKDEVELSSTRELSKLEIKGVIQSFEMVHELAWKLLKDFFLILGNADLYGSRDTFQLAFNNNLVSKGAILMDSIKSRNLSAHTYNQDTADDIFHKTVDSYYGAFEEIRAVMLKEKHKRNL